MTPILEIVAGDAWVNSWVSNRKLTFGPNWIRQPDGNVSNRLSSKTELSDSTHSGSISPSHRIHEWISENKKPCDLGIHLYSSWCCRAYFVVLNRLSGRWLWGRRPSIAECPSRCVRAAGFEALLSGSLCADGRSVPSVPKPGNNIPVSISFTRKNYNRKHEFRKRAPNLLRGWQHRALFHKSRLLKTTHSSHQAQYCQRDHHSCAVKCP